MRPDGFGYKTAWFAARNVSPEAFAAALALRNPQESPWQLGVEASYEGPESRSVFVTPRISDWTLCTGTVLLELTEGESPEFGSLLTKLADRLQTTVQFFASHRVVELHAWGRATPSSLQRAYMYVGESGETVMDLGSQSAEEQSLRFSFFNGSSPEASSDGYWEREDLTLPTEESVMQLAALWSLNPSEWPEGFEPGVGFLAKYGEPRTPQLLAASPATERAWWKFW